MAFRLKENAGDGFVVSRSASQQKGADPNGKKDCTWNGYF